MLLSVGVQSPDVETLLGFNDSLAQNIVNIKYKNKIIQKMLKTEKCFVPEGYNCPRRTHSSVSMTV
jgi:hypothetical protein